VLLFIWETGEKIALRKICIAKKFTNNFEKKFRHGIRGCENLSQGYSLRRRIFAKIFGKLVPRPPMELSFSYVREVSVVT
jgi:hypothetical protein